MTKIKLTTIQNQKLVSAMQNAQAYREALLNAQQLSQEANKAMKDLVETVADAHNIDLKKFSPQLEVKDGFLHLNELKKETASQVIKKKLQSANKKGGK